ncbi:MAG: SAM-dependent methyltransferase [Natronohydrobacter sp.]|nr:SAM-dependent methyltransferase [Natronohydrobacter sp.]
MYPCHARRAWPWSASTGPDCTIVVADPRAPAPTGIEGYPSLDILYWLHLSQRDLILQNPNHGDSARGTFSLRSPFRSNPSGRSTVRLIRRDSNRVTMRGLECVSGTPLIDIKPDRCHFTPVVQDLRPQGTAASCCRVEMKGKVNPITVQRELARMRESRKMA